MLQSVEWPPVCGHVYVMSLVQNLKEKNSNPLKTLKPFLIYVLVFTNNDPQWKLRAKFAIETLQTLHCLVLSLLHVCGHSTVIRKWLIFKAFDTPNYVIAPCPKPINLKLTNRSPCILTENVHILQ
jgi:hypothetical protein